MKTMSKQLAWWATIKKVNSKNFLAQIMLERRILRLHSKRETFIFKYMYKQWEDI